MVRVRVRVRRSLRVWVRVRVRVGVRVRVRVRVWGRVRTMFWSIDPGVELGLTVFVTSRRYQLYQSAKTD